MVGQTCNVLDVCWTCVRFGGVRVSGRVKGVRVRVRGVERRYWVIT